MEDPGSNKDSDQKFVSGVIEMRHTNTPVAEKGGGVGRVGEHVEESQDEEGEDVLNVILVSPSHSLNILVDALSGLTEKDLQKRRGRARWFVYLVFLLMALDILR